MHRVILALGCVALAAAAALPKTAPLRYPLPIPEVAIDLDAPAEHRWDAVMKSLVDQHGWDYTYKPVVEYINHILPPKLLAIIENISTDIGPSLPAEMYNELKGLEAIAQEIGHGADMPFSLLLTMNLLYEFTTACTSIVAMDSQQQMWHSRNLDWGFDGYSLRNISVQAAFQKNGQTVYQGVTWGGYVGLLTGLKKGSFSITIDQRTDTDVWDIVDALVRIKERKAVPVAYKLRQTLEDAPSFPQAVSALSQSEVSTPVYFIVGGALPGQGAVITRNESVVARDVWMIPNGPQPWYILETNYDHDKQPPQHDDRRDLAIHAMNALGQAAVTPDSLYQIMLTPAANGSIGVFNSDTQYTSVIGTTTGYFDSWTWQ